MPKAENRKRLAHLLRACSRCLEPHHAPVRRPRRKAQIHQPSGTAHRTNLGTGEALLQGGTEAIAGISAKGVEAAVAVVAEGEGGHGQASGFCQGCEAGEGPVDGEGDQVGNELLGAGRQAADQQAGGVGEAPEQAEPAGAVVEGVIEVEQQRCAGFEEVGGGADGGGGVGHVVEHAEAVAEILGTGRQTTGSHGGLQEVHIGLICQGLTGHTQGAGGIDAVQTTYARCHEAGPAAGATAHVEALGIGRQLIPGEDGEVIGKHPLGFTGGHTLLIKALPFIAEASDGTRVEVIRKIHLPMRPKAHGIR